MPGKKKTKEQSALFGSTTFSDLKQNAEFNSTNQAESDASKDSVMSTQANLKNKIDVTIDKNIINQYQLIKDFDEFYYNLYIILDASYTSGIKDYHELENIAKHYYNEFSKKLIDRYEGKTIKISNTIYQINNKDDLLNFIHEYKPYNDAINDVINFYKANNVKKKIKNHGKIKSNKMQSVSLKAFVVDKYYKEMSKGLNIEFTKVAHLRDKPCRIANRCLKLLNRNKFPAKRNNICFSIEKTKTEDKVKTKKRKTAKNAELEI